MTREICPCGEDHYVDDREVVYLSGPINGCSDKEARAWRLQIIEICGPRYHFLNPMDRDYRGIEDGNFEAIVEADLKDIAQCDIVVAYPWKASTGTSMENWDAHIEQKDIVVIAEDPVSPWWRFIADVVVPDVRNAAEYLINRYEAKRGTPRD